MSQVIRKVQTVLPRAASIFQASSLSPCPVWGGTVISQRQYRGRPTHGIGKWRHLVKIEPPRKKRERIQMKPIQEATETAFGTLNVQVSGYDMTLVEHYSGYIHKLCNRLGITVTESYALPTKTTEVLLLPDESKKMSVEAVLKTHERIIQPEGVDISVRQHTEADFNARFKSRPELEALTAKIDQ